MIVSGDRQGMYLFRPLDVRKNEKNSTSTIKNEKVLAQGSIVFLLDDMRANRYRSMRENESHASSLSFT
jgi:hypothetical protein